MSKPFSFGAIDVRLEAESEPRPASRCRCHPSDADIVPDPGVLPRPAKRPGCKGSGQ